MNNAVSFQLQLAPPPDVLVQKIQDEIVLLDMQQEEYFELDPVGSRMWELLTTCSSIQCAETSLLAEFDVDANRLRDDLAEFVRQLMARGLLEVAGA